MKHVGYPHQPGTLYDCSACESECFCDGDLTWTCVNCEGELWDESIAEVDALEGDCNA